MKAFLVIISLVIAGSLVVIASPPSHPTSGPNACWTEVKRDLPSERICGDVHKAPLGSIEFANVP
jgi:hypothetical protein